jgi:hypothetical protein
MCLKSVLIILTTCMTSYNDYPLAPEHLGNQQRPRRSCLTYETKEEYVLADDNLQYYLKKEGMVLKGASLWSALSAKLS